MNMTSIRTAKASVVAKLLKAKYFVVVTEKEAFMHLKSVNPRKLKDMVMLAEQQAAIELFRTQLTNVLEEHERRVDELAAPKKKGTKRAKSTRK